MKQNYIITTSTGFFITLIFLCCQFPLIAHSAPLDTDQDGLSDTLEAELGTNPTVLDTDGDGFSDGEEVRNGFNPLKENRDRSLPRRVEVNLTEQTATFYLNNIPIETFSISSGKLGTPTPTGTFHIMRKLATHDYVGPGYNLPGIKWNMEFKRTFYLHGANWHNQFGIRPMSHGCVNISYINAEKLYHFLSPDDTVIITGETPRRVIAHNQAKKTAIR